MLRKLGQFSASLSILSLLHASNALLSFLVEEKTNTHLLLGMCLDTYARYLLFSKQPAQAQRMYEKALQISEEILGERHPQVREESRGSVRRSFQDFWVRNATLVGDRSSAGGARCYVFPPPPPAPQLLVSERV